MSERPIALPVEAPWPTQRLDALCSIVSRGAAPTYVERSDVLAIGQRCVTANGFDASVARPHSTNTRNALLAEPGDVLLNSTGTGTIGRSCVFEELGKYAADTHVTVLRPQRAELDGYWLDSMLRSPWGQRHLERFCYSGSTNQVELHRAQIASTRLPVPPLDEQAAFREVFAALNTTIRQTEAIIEKLKQVKQGLLHDLLTRGIDANGELRPSASDAAHLYKDSPLGPIPLDWRAAPFSSLANFINGNTFDAERWSEQGLPIIRIQNLNGAKEFNYYDGVPSPKWHIWPGDLLFAWSGQRGVSFGARIWPGPEGVLNQHIFKVEEKSSLVTKQYLFEALRFRQSAIEDSAHGFKDSFLHVTRGELGGVMAGVPPLEEQELITSRIGAFEKRLGSEQLTHGKLAALKSGLMDDLLTGRVRVAPLLPQEHPA